MYRNPAYLLALDSEPVSRLMRACGIDQSGSDYDRFVAFASAMALCEGNTLAISLQETLRRETELDISLCPHTAPLFWRRWVELYWCDDEEESVELPTDCSACQPVVPTPLSDAEVASISCLPPVGRPPMSLVRYADYLQTFLPVEGYAEICLPTDYTFRRPDPYHAGEALREISVEGRGDVSLLLTQALRVLGGAAIARDVTLVLRGGAPEAILSLLAYLAECAHLPRMVWLPDDPAHAAAVSGLYASVGTGYVLPANLSPEMEGKIAASYAAVAPIGRAIVRQLS